MDYSWRSSLDQAIARNRRDAHHRYMQLATLDASGHPANRTVVFRGFLDDGALTLVTDARSHKVQQVIDHPEVEICWYFTRSREQFRIGGQLQLIDDSSPREELRSAAWSRLSEGAREQFYWPTPAAPRDKGEEPATGDDGVPTSFLLGVVIPERIDHLQLAGSPQQRCISIRGEDGEWRSEAVNP